jgi:class 3 adenylate cyclase
VAVCGHCGRESPDDFGFCPSCGAPLPSAPAAREVRKVVSVLFCDLTGSTEIGDRTDPETLRAMMRRYYETARTVLERHGGTVEKFVGDAVMAVFGIPVATEDDALRAVRAAVERRDTVHGLGLEARIGVNTGDVVAGEGDTLVTGDAVNVSARLEQTAGPGEILLGQATLSLVRDAVTTEPMQLSLKGKPGEVAGHRLISLDTTAAGVARRLDRPMVGRHREGERLEADFSDAVESRTCRLFTLIGPAGVGTSRLVAEFLSGVGETATVARGRALSYGEGITYWPLVEILIQLGLEPEAAIRSSPADTQLATRALFEAAAEERPLVLVLDDLQWAEGPMLDLVEHIADWSREAPIFLLCIARPELLDARPGWGGGKLNATSILLEPLGEAEAVALADGLLDGIALDADTRARILAIAEGNPLFLEEMAALAREADGVVQVPPTIQALLQARLDTLNEAERSVIERGSVEGKVFHRGAVAALVSPRDREEVGGQLLALVRKELVRPDRSEIPGEDAFRFRHLLIRDTAYDSLPKAVRADLHERFAEWLDAYGELLEQDELVGYHLERAATLLAELDPDHPRQAEIAGRAAHRLSAAGHAAFEHGNHHAARGLLSRAHALLPEGPERRRLIPTLVEVLDQGPVRDQVPALIDELRRGDEVDRAMASVVSISDDVFGEERSLESARREVERASDVLRATADDRALGRAAFAAALVAWGAARSPDALVLFRRAWDHFEAAGTHAYRASLIDWIAGAMAFAGTPLDEAVRTVDRLEASVEQDSGPLMAATLSTARARSGFIRGDISFDDLRRVQSETASLHLQTGSERAALSVQGFAAMAAHLAGDDALAERIDRERSASFERRGDLDVLANSLAGWAIGVARVGRPEEALRIVGRARAIAREDDIADQIEMDAAEGLARAYLGDPAALDFVERARERARGLVMVPLERQLAEIEATVRSLMGDREGSRRIAQELVGVLEETGAHRYADFVRHAFLDETSAAS